MNDLPLPDGSTPETAASTDHPNGGIARTRGRFSPFCVKMGLGMEPLKQKPHEPFDLADAQAALDHALERNRVARTQGRNDEVGRGALDILRARVEQAEQQAMEPEPPVAPMLFVYPTERDGVTVFTIEGEIDLASSDAPHRSPRRSPSKVRC